jgi:excisionase family DNA binding protein
MSSCLLSKQAFLLRTGLSLSTLNRHLKESRIRFIRLGSRVLIPESEILRLADLAEFGGADAPVITAADQGGR